MEELRSVYGVRWFLSCSIINFSMVKVCVCNFNDFSYPYCLRRATCLLNSLTYSSSFFSYPPVAPLWEKASSFCSYITRLLYILSSRTSYNSSLRFFIYSNNCILILFNLLFYPYIIYQLLSFYLYT